MGWVCQGKLLACSPQYCEMQPSIDLNTEMARDSKDGRGGGLLTGVWTLDPGFRGSDPKRRVTGGAAASLQMTSDGPCRRKQTMRSFLFQSES